MEFKVYYDKMTLDEVNRFNREWRLLDANIENKSFFEKNVLNSWLKKDGGFKKALTAETHDKYIGDKTRDYLKYKVLGYSKFDRDIEQDLITKYIIIGNEIPDDFVSMMLEYVRSLATTLINDEPIKVISTPFLKLLLKEVFIPFNLNPLIIQKFDYFGYINAEKDNKKIVFCEDYFMFSKLPEIKEIEDLTQITELAGYIKEYCEDIPDLIRYELDLGKQQRFDPNEI